jgi:hypothetical protein
MSDNPNKQTENPPLDADDWENAFEPYKGHPGAALQLSFCLNALRDYLYEDPLDAEFMSEAIDRAITALYPHSDFHMLCRKFFNKVVEGDMTLEEEQMIKKLGIKF